MAYNSLLQERRRVLHAQIVEALETLASDRRDEQVDLLAQHAVRGRWGQSPHLLPAGGDQGVSPGPRTGGGGGGGPAGRSQVLEQALEARPACSRALANTTETPALPGERLPKGWQIKPPAPWLALANATPTDAGLRTGAGLQPAHPRHGRPPSGMSGSSLRAISPWGGPIIAWVITVRPWSTCSRP